MREGNQKLTEVSNPEGNQWNTPKKILQRRRKKPLLEVLRKILMYKPRTGRGGAEHMR